MNVGTLQYSLNVLIIAVPAAVAGLIILLVLVFSITCCIYVRFKRSNKERDRQFQGLLAQMELMESELAEECRRGGLQLCGCTCMGVSSPVCLVESIRQHAFSIAHLKSVPQHSIALSAQLSRSAHSLAACIHLCVCDIRTSVDFVVECKPLLNHWVKGVSAVRNSATWCACKLYCLP